MTIEERKARILSKIDDLQGESIPLAELQAAYEEGVNSA